MCNVANGAKISTTNAGDRISGRHKNLWPVEAAHVLVWAIVVALPVRPCFDLTIQVPANTHLNIRA